MVFTETKLKGAFLVRMKRIEDNRGYFARAWCASEYAQHGLNPNVAQINAGFNLKQGTVRGMHFQASPHEEAKSVRCISGAIYDVIVDLRPDSETFLQWFGTELTAESGDMLYIPEGCAHGYQALVDGAVMHYMASVPYSAASASGVRYDDPAFGISWPLPITVISDADRKWPDYRLPHLDTTADR